VSLQSNGSLREVMKLAAAFARRSPRNPWQSLTTVQSLFATEPFGRIGNVSLWARPRHSGCCVECCLRKKSRTRG